MRTMTRADRTLLPRGLIARQSFQIGQLVIFHGMTGKIVDASVSLRGQHLYTVIFDIEERPERVIRGEYLQPAPTQIPIFLMLFEPGTVVRLKNRQTLIAGQMRPDLPGVDLLADGQPMLTATEKWLKENVDRIGLPQAA